MVTYHRLKAQSMNALNIQKELQDKLKEHELLTVELKQQLSSLTSEATELQVINQTLATENKNLDRSFKDSIAEVKVLKV